MGGRKATKADGMKATNPKVTLGEGQTQPPKLFQLRKPLARQRRPGSVCRRKVCVQHLGKEVAHTKFKPLPQRPSVDQAPGEGASDETLSSQIGLGDRPPPRATGSPTGCQNDSS